MNIRLARQSGAERPTVSELDSVPLFAHLLKEQKELLAASMKVDTFDMGHAIEVVGPWFCVVLKGVVEVRPTEAILSEQERLKTQGHIAVRRLKAGEHLGAVWALESFDASLHAFQDGTRVGIVSGPFLRALMFDWPELLEAYAQSLEQERNELLRRLMLAEAELADRTLVLERIERVTNLMLLQGGANIGKKEREVRQRKWLLKGEPEEKLKKAKKQEIEQGYLKPPEGFSEDRIRKIVERGSARFVRTRRIGKGEDRREHEEELSATEYALLREKIQGKLIRKIRWAWKERLDGSEVKITVDKFLEPEEALEKLDGKLLLEMTVDRKSEKVLKQLDPATVLGVSVDREVTGKKDFGNKVLAGVQEGKE